jgi:hypothetical protein
MGDFLAEKILLPTSATVFLVARLRTLKFCFVHLGDER